MTNRRTVLLLPGQGAQRERMGAELYGRQPAFTTYADSLFRSLDSDGDKLAAEWQRPAPNPALDDVGVAQSLLLVVGYALGQAVHAVTGGPDILLGHSAGELAAACLAGVFPPEDLLPLLAARSRTLHTDGRGGMLAVAAAPDELPEPFEPGIALAAINGPRHCILAGPEPALGRTSAALSSAGFALRHLRSSHAFHSPVMRPTAARFRGELGEVRLRPPHSTLISSRTTAPVTPSQATDPSFWADQLLLPVLFWPALKSLLDQQGHQPGLILLDGSADRSLSAAARRHPAVRSGRSLVVPLLAPAEPAADDTDLTAWTAAAELLAGGDPSLRRTAQT
ncbi:acyltransferase domain-containing protein [Actinoplanes sp. NPDC049265]|uniref:acyltransferase domain-containing protein n=1 Tax=Actinoplanes sp. NPDC049265 TaxID=3363902 RepID=UPI0037234569